MFRLRTYKNKKFLQKSAKEEKIENFQRCKLNLREIFILQNFDWQHKNAAFQEKSETGMHSSENVKQGFSEAVLKLNFD